MSIFKPNISLPINNSVIAHSNGGAIRTKHPTEYDPYERVLFNNSQTFPTKPPANALDKLYAFAQEQNQCSECFKTTDATETGCYEIGSLFSNLIP